MAITSPPTPPNTGNPAQLESRADAFFGWFPTFVSDFNSDLPLLRGRAWATRGGSANAITLTAGFVSLPVGTCVRFKATSSNTGAATINLDGLGAKPCRTVTGADLPAGYIRTDVETVATYDGTYWVLDRQIERGENSNGKFARWADGTQVCTALLYFPNGVTQSQGSLFFSDELSLTPPAAFVNTAAASGGVATSNNQWINSRVSSGGDIVYARIFGPVSNAVARTVVMSIIGTWY